MTDMISQQAVVHAEEISNIVYLLWRGYYQSAQTRSDAAFRRSTAPARFPHFPYWRAVGHLLLGKPDVAIRELSALIDEPALPIACHVILLLAHRRAPVVNQDAATDLDAAINVAESTISSGAGGADSGQSIPDIAYFALIVGLALLGQDKEAEKWLQLGRQARAPDASRTASYWTELAAGWLRIVQYGATLGAAATFGSQIIDDVGRTLPDDFNMPKGSGSGSQSLDSFRMGAASKGGSQERVDGGQSGGGSRELGAERRTMSTTNNRGNWGSMSTDLGSTAPSIVSSQTSEFEVLLKANPRDAAVLIGQLVDLRFRKARYDDALTTAAQVLASSPRSPPALIESIYCSLESGAWDHTTDSCHRVLGTGASSDADGRPRTAAVGSGGAGGGGNVPTLDALLVILLIVALRDGNVSKSKQYMSSLLTSLRREEPENPRAMFFVLRVLSRMPFSAAFGDDLMVAGDKMCQLDPKNALAQCVQADLLLLVLNRPRPAREAYQRALRINSHCVQAMEGSAFAEWAIQAASAEMAAQRGHGQGPPHLSKASAHEVEASLLNDIELLETLPHATGRTAYLSSAVHWRRTKDVRVRLSHLRACIERIMAQSSRVTGLDYLVALDLNVLQRAANDLVELCPSAPSPNPPPQVALLLQVAEQIACIQLKDPSAAHLFAFAQFLAGNLPAAKALIKEATDRFSQHVPIAFLAAEICLAQARQAQADASASLEGEATTEVRGSSGSVASSAQEALGDLDAALAVSLELRKHPFLNVLMAQAQRLLGNVDAAQKALSSVPSSSVFNKPREKLLYWTECLLLQGTAASSTLKTARQELSEHPNLAAELQVLEAKVLLGASATTAPRLSIGPQATTPLPVANVDNALELLKEAARDPCVALDATRLLWQIHWYLKRDRRAAVQRVQDLVDALPGLSDAQNMLADVYLAVGDIDRAIDTLTTALCYFPDVPLLAQRIGSILVRNHEYTRALEYMQDAVASATAAQGVLGAIEQTLALTALQVKLEQYADAERVLTSTLQDIAEEQPTGSTTSVARVAGKRGAAGPGRGAPPPELKLVRALSDVYVAQGRRALALEALQHARDLSKSAGAQAEVCVATADVLLNLKADVDAEEGAAKIDEYAARAKAETLLVQANELSQSNADTQLKLVQLYLHTHTMPSPEAIAAAQKEAAAAPESPSSGTPASRQVSEALTKAHAICTDLLKAHPDHPDGTRLMAQIMMHRRQFDQVLAYQVQYLRQHQKRPDDLGVSRSSTSNTSAAADKKPKTQPFNFGVLAQAIDLMHRLGRLDEAKEFLNPEEAPGAGQPGFYYCLGLVHLYKEEIKEAVHNFRKCRGDIHWHPKAVCQLLEILLFPDLSNVEKEVPAPAQAAAAKLLEDLPASTERTVWEAYMEFAPRTRPGIEEGLDLLRKAPDSHAGVLLAKALGQRMLQNIPKSKNYLKRLAAREWDLEDASSLETGWLLLAEGYMEVRKNAAADALVKSILDFNPQGGRGAWRAWALFGESAEKAGKWGEAATHYQRAWAVQGKSSAELAARCAFAVAKAGMPTQAIRMAHTAMRLAGATPSGASGGGMAGPGIEAEAMAAKMQKEVLEPARLALRP